MNRNFVAGRNNLADVDTEVRLFVAIKDNHVNLLSYGGQLVAVKENPTA